MINLNMSNNNSLQGNVFVKPEDQRELARFGLARKRRRSQHKPGITLIYIEFSLTIITDKKKNENITNWLQIYLAFYRFRHFVADIMYKG